MRDLVFDQLLLACEGEGGKVRVRGETAQFGGVERIVADDYGKESVETSLDTARTSACATV
jgi:hypothetical protein